MTAGCNMDRKKPRSASVTTVCIDNPGLTLLSSLYVFSYSLTDKASRLLFLSSLRTRGSRVVLLAKRRTSKDSGFFIDYLDPRSSRGPASGMTEGGFFCHPCEREDPGSLFSQMTKRTTLDPRFPLLSFPRTRESRVLLLATAEKDNDPGSFIDCLDPRSSRGPASRMTLKKQPFILSTYE